jgi:hypothetical protein
MQCSAVDRTAMIAEAAMTNEREAMGLREAVGVLGSAEALEAAIDELASSGFDRNEISLLATEKAVEKKLGHRYSKVAELEDDETVPRAAYVSTESTGDAEGALIGGLLYVGAIATAGAIVASGGTLAAVITGAALAGGTGGLVGAVLAKLVGDHHARYLQEQIDHGGLLLWVRTTTPEREARATAILARHSGQDVHVHTLPAG